ncbi:hypothetical protein HK096_005966, partial [Nowakowskiella sp. JEL0078]
VKSLEIEVDSGTKSRAIQICHRSLIFLGDLSRYREAHSEKKEKNWAAARSFYNFALLLIPDNGNPYNQFAVIDTYEGDELGSVERYFRSLVVKQPFSTALENLHLLFEKAKKREFTGLDDENVKARGVFTKDFTILMGRMMAKEKEFEIFDSTKNNVLIQLGSLLSTLNFDAKLLSRVFTVSLSLLYLQTSLTQTKTLDSLSSNHLQKRGANSDTIDSQQILVLFLCEQSCVVLTQTNKLLLKQIQNYKPPKSQKLLPESFAHGTLPALKILTKWLLIQSHSQLTFTMINNYESELKLWALIAEFANLVCRLVVLWSPEVGRSSLDDIVEMCRSRNFIDGHRWKVPVLKQDIELKGFLPLIFGDNEEVEDNDYDVYEEFEGRGGREMEAWMAVQILQFLVGITENINPKLFVSLSMSASPIQFSSTLPPQPPPSLHPPGLSSRSPTYVEPDDLRFSHRPWTTTTPFSFPESPTIPSLHMQNLSNFPQAPHFVQQIIKPTAIGSERRSSISGAPPGLSTLNHTGPGSAAAWPSTITTPSSIVGLELDVLPKAEETSLVASVTELSDDVNTIAFLGLENTPNADLTFPELKFSIQSIPLSLTSPGLSQKVPQQSMWMNSPVIPWGIHHGQDEAHNGFQQRVFAPHETTVRLKSESRSSWIGGGAKDDFAAFTAWR